MRDKLDDPLPTKPLTLTQIEVDLNQLSDFRALLERELELNLRPAVADIHTDLGIGVMFGRRIAGRGVQSAREQYQRALQASNHNLATYIEISELLIAAIRQLTRNYSDTDLSAQQIIGALHDAADAAPPRAPTPPGTSIPPSVANLGLYE